MSLQANKEKALTIVQQGKRVNSLNVAELDLLLAWHHAPKIKSAKNVDNLQQ
jgi:hypothetical protein